jgi:type IV pilus assembly protein PilC
MEFSCRLVTARGEIVEGVYTADTEARLRHELEDKGLHILALRPRVGIGGFSFALPRRRRISPREFLEFNQELATLLKAGMPLVQSLDLLRGGMADPLFRSVLDAVYERVKAGSALSDAFEEHGALFPRVYTASLMAGERSGSLEVVLRRYVAYTKLAGAVRRKTISALIYPAGVVSLAVGVVSVIVLKLVPAFSDFYASFNAELPLVTRIIVRGSSVLSHNILLVLAAIAFAGMALVYWVRQPGVRLGMDRALLRLPWAGDVARKFSTAQLARTLATLLGGGIPLVNALEIAGRSIGNRHMARELENVAQSVREGQGLAATMRTTGLFPDVAVKMTEVGEATGALQEMLNSLSEFYDEEIETNMDRFVTLVEPVLLITMGLVIAALLLALYMPLFQLTSVISLGWRRTGV